MRDFKGTRDLLNDLPFWEQYGLYVLPEKIEKIEGLTLFECVKCHFKTHTYLAKRKNKQGLWRLYYGPTPK